MDHQFIDSEYSHHYFQKDFEDLEIMVSFHYVEFVVIELLSDVRLLFKVVCVLLGLFGT